MSAAIFDLQCAPSAEFDPRQRVLKTSLSNRAGEKLKAAEQASGGYCGHEGTSHDTFPAEPNSAEFHPKCRKVG